MQALPMTAAEHLTKSQIGRYTFFKRKQGGMFKPVRMTDQTTCVSPFDPAIDFEQSDWGEYSKVIFKDPAAWRKFIKPKEGESLTEFIIGVIPTEHINRISDECSGEKGKITKPNEMQWRAFIHGLKGINNWPDKIPTSGINGTERVDLDWIKETFIRDLRQTALHVGAVAWAFNQLSGDEVKN
jgi:hypothetical protein